MLDRRQLPKHISPKECWALLSCWKRLRGVLTCVTKSTHALYSDGHPLDSSLVSIFRPNEATYVANPFPPNSAARHWSRCHMDFIFVPRNTGALGSLNFLSRLHNPKLGGFLPGIGYGGGFFRPILGSLYRPIHKYMFCSLVSAC